MCRKGQLEAMGVADERAGAAKLKIGIDATIGYPRKTPFPSQLLCFMSVALSTSLESSQEHHGVRNEDNAEKGLCDRSRSQGEISRPQSQSKSRRKR